MTPPVCCLASIGRKPNAIGHSSVLDARRNTVSLQLMHDAARFKTDSNPPDAAMRQANVEMDLKNGSARKK
jgi:hypothetical protein